MDPESYTYDKKKRACLENPKKEEPKKQEAPTPDKVEVKTIKKEKKAEVTVTKKTVTIKAKPDIKAIKKQVKKLSKKDCTKAGLRYSRKRKYCYLKCRSKSRKFNPEQFKCLKEEELKAIKAAAAKKQLAEEKAAEEAAIKAEYEAAKEAAMKANEIAFKKAAKEEEDKKACKEAGRRFSKSKGCTEKCANKLHEFNKEKNSC